MSDVTSRTNLFGLPAELVAAVTGEWLNLRDMVRLDSAVCESEARSVLHASFRSLDASVIGADYKMLDLAWMLTRRIHMEAVFYPRTTDKDDKADLVQMFGHRIRFLAVTPSSCARIAVIYHPDVSSLLMMDSIRFVEDQKKISSLSSSDETKRSPMYTTTSSVGLLPSSHLQLLSVDITVDSATEAWLYSLIAPECVQRLRPTFLYIYDWQRFTSLRSLGFNGTRQLGIDKLTTICIQCSEIVHLDLSKGADLLSDAMVSVVVRHLRCVRSLNLEGGREITDGSLMDLVSSHQHSLEALCIYNCYFVTATAINHITTHCTQLRTFSFLPKDGVDFSLLSNITTLITSFPRDTAKWTLLQQHCICVEQLYFVVTWDRYSRPLTALHCEEDVLHKLHTLHHAIEPLSQVKPAEVLAAVHYVRPSVQVRTVEFQTWYNLFELPIDFD